MMLGGDRLNGLFPRKPDSWFRLFVKFELEMKRYLLFPGLLLITFGFMLPSIGLRAQSPDAAEFHLDLHYRDTVSGTVDSLIGRAFGYDPQASDGYDAAFGEDPSYPGSIFAANDFYFNRPYPDSATRVDIRHKPSTDSFALTYSLGLSFEQYPGSIFWDPSQIPAIIKGIWISAYETDTPLVDMKKTNIFTESNASVAASWGTLTITIFYNMEPHYISPAAVSGSAANGGGLIASATVFPNPMPSGGALDVTLSQAASLSIAGYDVTGREVLRLARGGMGGENILDLSTALANVHGAIMLHIDASSTSEKAEKNVMLVRP
jgi:hypothetical protein